MFGGRVEYHLGIAPTADIVARSVSEAFATLELYGPVRQAGRLIRGCWRDHSSDPRYLYLAGWYELQHLPAVKSRTARS